jgi:predicted RNA-binding Zn-ribbon protein involved in translation (DUF1610 family)
MENRECINCKQPIKPAWINTGAGVLVLEQPIKGLKRKACGVKAYVCPNCGHVELVADNPELFE